MIVIHIKNTMGLGGAETMLTDILNIQVNYVKVFLIIMSNRISEELIERIDKRVSIIYLNGKPNSKNPILFFKLNYQILKIQADVIHIHEQFMLKRIMPFVSKKIVSTVHNVNLYTPFWKRVSHLFAISKTVLNDISSHGYKNVTLAYNGIDSSIIRKKTTYKQTGDKISMICVGRFINTQKGQDLLIKAIYNLVNKKHISNIHLTLLGYGKSEDLYRKLISDLKLEQYIEIIHKERSFVYEHLRDYDLAIQPSIFEGFGLTVAEAIVAGLPVLVSNIDGPMEIIDNGKYGYYFESQNIDSLTDSLSDIILNYSNSLEKVKPAMMFVENHFSIESSVLVYLSNY